MSKPIFILLFAVLAVSCEKSLLEPNMESYLTANEAITDIPSLQAAVNGCYDALQSSSYYGRDFVAMGDVCSDNCQISPLNSDLLTDLHTISPTSADKHLEGFWKAAYKAIDRCNRSIKAADELIGIDQDQCTQLKSEAIFIRSLAYFDLVRVFAPSPASSDSKTLAVPYITAVSDSVIAPPRMALRPLIDSLEADLKWVQENIGQAGNKFTASADASKLLLARIYLYNREYANAYTQALPLTQEGNYSLISYEDYPFAFSAEENSETVFSLAFNKRDFNRTASLGYFYAKEGYAAYQADDALLDEHTSTDVRLKLFQTTDGTYSTKFGGKDRIIGTDNIPILRFSEALLIVAESLNHLGYTSIAVEYMTTFMLTRDPNIAELDVKEAELREIIIKERQKEFAFEGMRFFDLKRLERGINRSSCQTECNISYSSKFAFPVPEYELNANPNIE